MRKLFLLTTIFFFVGYNARAQFYVGPQAGMDIGNIYLGSLPVITENAYTYHKGLLVTFLPSNGKKPGLKMALSSSSIAYDEVGPDYRISYVNKGFDFDLLSHLYVRFGKVRAFVDAGTGISHYDNRSVPDQSQSELPAFSEFNIKKTYIFLTGGTGAMVELGRLHLGASGAFSYGMGNVYKNIANFSSPYHIRVSVSMQVRLGKKDSD